jgi:hypothetical protein
VRSNPYQPGDERCALPFEAGEAGERLVKDFGGYIFCVLAAGRATRNEDIDAVEVGLVKLGEAARVPLRSFDQMPLVGVVLGYVQIESPQDRWN